MKAASSVSKLSRKEQKSFYVNDNGKNFTILMEIYQLIQGVNNQSAGPTYSVSRLAEELAGNGHNTEIISLGSDPENWQSRSDLKNFVPDGLGQFIGYQREHFNYVRGLLDREVIMHGHGIWRYTNLFPLYKKNIRAKLVCSPRGMLTTWSMNYKKWRKLPFWTLVQKPALDRVDLFHATSDMEYEDIRRLGFRQPISIIPNGVDIPDISNKFRRKKNIVFLSRIDPKKGLDMLLPAWRAVSKLHSDWNLNIVGPLDSNYAQSVMLEARKLNLTNIVFKGALHGQDKYGELTEASLFVLPTYSENFGLVVAEAFAHGLPVITTSETPWLELDKKGCGWTIKPDQSELEQTMLAALSEEEKLVDMGAKGRQWMEQEFSWGSVVEKMEESYHEILTGRSFLQAS